MAEDKSLLPEKGIENIKTKVSNDRRLLTFLDVLLSSLVITPAVVGTWGGLWCLIDNRTPIFPVWESYMFALMILLAFTLLREVLQYYVSKSYKGKSFPKRVGMFLFRFLYMYIFLVISILQWRGGFPLFDYVLSMIFTENMTTNKLKIVFLTLVLLIVLLCALRSLTTVIAAPFAIATDSVDTTFDFPTRMRVSVSNKILLILILNQKNFEKKCTYIINNT